jgi:hypothetical protein
LLLLQPLLKVMPLLLHLLKVMPLLLHLLAQMIRRIKRSKQALALTYG